MGRMIRNISESEIARRRSEHSQKQLSKDVQSLFTEQCRFRSLFSRVNRCLKDFYSTMLAPVDGVRVTHPPTLKVDVPYNSMSFDKNFTGSWGGQGGVHAELFGSFRDTAKEAIATGIAPNYEPREDHLRVPLGAEFNYAFSPYRFKRPRPSSTNRLTPDGKGKN